jgi:hypothetical protein
LRGGAIPLAESLPARNGAAINLSDGAPQTGQTTGALDSDIGRSARKSPQLTQR